MTASPTTAAITTAPRSRASLGLIIALVSALAFGISGPFAKSLLEAGWSPGAAVLVRIGGGAIVLLIAAAILVRKPWRTLRPKIGSVTAYGVVAVAGAQLCYFNAVQYLPISVALLIEYSAPVLIVLWLWARSRVRPTLLTLAGTVVALGGLALVLDLGNADSINIVGVLWASGAALCLAGYFLITARIGEDVPPLLVAGAGMAIGSVLILALALVGVVPLTIGAATVTLAGMQTSWILPVAVLVLVSCVAAYLTGIQAVHLLGAKVSSFVALTEVLFAVLASWIMLAEAPGWLQAIGGVLIVGGVVLVRLGDSPVAAVGSDAITGSGTDAGSDAGAGSDAAARGLDGESDPEPELIRASI